MPRDLFKLAVASVSADIIRTVYSVSPTDVAKNGADGTTFYLGTKKFDKKYNFIFYQKGDDARAYKEFLKEIIDTENEGIKALLFETINEFINAWNNLGIVKYKGRKVEVPIGCVIIACHGEPTAINCYYKNERLLQSDSKKHKIPIRKIIEGSSYNDEDASSLDDAFLSIGLDIIKEKLEKKEIETLLLLPCNSGHMEYKANLATTFAANQNIRGILAPDGLLYYKFNEEFKPYSYTIKTISDKGAYTGYWKITSSRDRLPQGFINYSTGEPKKTGVTEVTSKRCLADLIKLAHMY